MKKNCQVAWENDLENHVFSKMKEADIDAQTYCKLMSIKFNENKHINVVIPWLIEE